MPRISKRVRFAGGCGFELAGIIDRPEDNPSAPVAVFSHCFTCNKDLRAIVRISRALAEHGIAVLRYDMTGLGGSDGDFSQTSFTTNLADLKEAIRFATSELGPVTALVGHSFGGAVSLGFAGAIEDSSPGIDVLPRAVVTIAAPSDTQHLAWLLAKLDPKIETTGEGSVTIGGRQWRIRREMLEDFRRHDLPAAISRVEAPTLLVHSRMDATVSFDHALRIMSLIQTAPDTTTPVSLISLDQADHLLSGPVSDIDFVASTTAAFLRRYSQTPWPPKTRYTSARSVTP